MAFRRLLTTKGTAVMPELSQASSSVEPLRWSVWQMALAVLGSAFGVAPTSGVRSPEAGRSAAK